MYVETRRRGSGDLCQDTNTCESTFRQRRNRRVRKNNVNRSEIRTGDECPLFAPISRIDLDKQLSLYRIPRRLLSVSMKQFIIHIRFPPHELSTPTLEPWRKKMSRVHISSLSLQLITEITELLQPTIEK